jgi:hypothetical protein
MRGIEPRERTLDNISSHDHFLDADKTDNVVIICSPLTNTVADEALRELRHQTGVDWDITREGSRRQIMFDNHPWPEPSGGEGGPEEERVDYALLAKFSLNSWAPDSKVILLAGLRAFGSWGAGWYLFHQLDRPWPQLRLRPDPKDNVELKEGAGEDDFGVVLEVTCKGWRIIKARAVSKFVKI